jgi:hypothetical protein
MVMEALDSLRSLNTNGPPQRRLVSVPAYAGTFPMPTKKVMAEQAFGAQDYFTVGVQKRPV